MLLLNSHDDAYYGGWAGLCAYIETTFAFLVVCLPVMPKLIAHVLKRMGFSHARSGEAASPPHPEKREDANPRQQRSWWHISRTSNGAVSIGEISPYKFPASDVACCGIECGSHRTLEGAVRSNDDSSV